MTVLRCKLESGQTLEVWPETLCSGFNEQGTYHFEIGNNETCRFYIDEVLSDIVVLDGSQTWVWRPGFYAGEVAAELVDSDGIRIAYYRLDVSPHSQKLGQDTFNRMIDEIFAFDANLLIGTEAAQASIGVQGDSINAHLAYARLRRYGAKLITSLKALSVQPLTRLHHIREMRPPNEIRRFDQTSVKKLLRNPNALSIVKNGSNGPTNLGSTLFDIKKSFDDLNNPANQTIAATLKAVSRRVRVVTDELNALAANESLSTTRTALTPRIARRISFLDELSSSLKRISRSRPFASISKPEVSSSGLTSISAHPIYARAFRYGWNILRSGVAGEVKDESFWISPTFEIYERWSYLKIVQILKFEYPELNWKCTYPNKNKDDYIRFTGIKGATVMEIWLQLKFPAYDLSEQKEFRSISAERRPDIVITLDSPEKKCFIVLDAKYRTKRSSVLEGMQSAHIYRDSLRWNNTAPAAVYLLIPRGGEAQWLEEDVFRNEHNVGVLQLGNELDLANIGRVLSGLLNKS